MVINRGETHGLERLPAECLNGVTRSERARRDLLDVLFRAASAGSGVLVAGMDAHELQSMCDRVLIMREGTVADEIRGDDVTVEHVVNAVYRNGANGRPVMEGVS